VKIEKKILGRAFPSLFYFFNWLISHFFIRMPLRTALYMPQAPARTGRFRVNLILTFRSGVTSMGELEEFLSENGLSGAKKISKGWSSDIFLAQDAKGRKCVLKVLHAKSNRRHMSQKETEFLRLANTIGVGPHWLKTDSSRNIVMMEFIDGVPFSEWIFGKISKTELKNFIDSLIEQARKLDEIGLDHGQLAGKGKNILVRGGMPVIIDFEKASRSRKVHNVKVLESFLFRSKDSGVVKRISELLGC